MDEEKEIVPSTSANQLESTNSSVIFPKSDIISSSLVEKSFSGEDYQDLRATRNATTMVDEIIQKDHLRLTAGLLVGNFHTSEGPDTDATRRTFSMKGLLFKLFSRNKVSKNVGVPGNSASEFDEAARRPAFCKFRQFKHLKKNSRQ